jgi:hypothetical protein
MLIVKETTDGKYVAKTFPIDPHSPPPVITTPDGARFEPIEWSEVSPKLWRVRNSNYTVWAEEIG